MDEVIRLAKEQAYHKGYLAAYRRGVEDCKSGKADTRMEPVLLDGPIQFLYLSKRPFNSLDRAGCRTIRDVVSLNQQEIWKIRNLGRKGLCEIARALWNHGIRDSAWNEWLHTD